MPIIFKAKTDNAYQIKIMAELLSQNIKTGCFEIDEKGIFLSMMDHHRRVLVDLQLHSENFSVFKFKHPGRLYVGLNLNHFHKMLKSIKKKDSIQLFIDDESPSDLGIKVIPKENNRITTSFVKIQNIQNIVIDMPSGYNKPIIVSSSEIQKLLKDMSNIGTTIRVISKNSKIQFECDAGGVLKRNVQFGEAEDPDDVHDTPDANEFDQEFSTEQLCRISKMAGFSSNMQIYVGHPILFKSNIGSLGKISIYVKSKEQIERESCNINTDYDSE